MTHAVIEVKITVTERKKLETLTNNCLIQGNCLNMVPLKIGSMVLLSLKVLHYAFDFII